jgi:peptidoglycan hydrolase-like protein with peptidoglycan-binding domain
VPGVRVADFPARKETPVRAHPRTARLRPTFRWTLAGTLVAAASMITPGAAVAAVGSAPAPTGAAAPSPAPSASPPAAVPAVPAGLPAGLEDLSPYLEQVSCDPAAKPGAVALGKLLLATYPGTSYAISRACGADGMASEHYEGRAADWMTSVRDPSGAARAEAFVGWLLAPDAQGRAFANARRLGVMYVIWNDRIWGSYAAGSGWRPYSTCARHPEVAWDTGCHRDHVHVSLSWAGAMGRTSFWSRRVAATDYGPCRPADLNWAPPYSGPNPAPCPSYPAVTAGAASSPVAAAIARYSGATVAPGSTGPVVTAVQRALGVPADGQFGSLTGAAVSAFRAAHGLPPGTSTDAATWRALRVAVASAPAPGPGPAPGRTPAPASGPSTSTPSPQAAPAPKPLSYGDSGPAVVALQRTLHVTPVSGWFGPVTRAAVTAFQRAHGLPATGIVDAATRRALPG